jgi:signal transduction histidine kinase
VTVAGLAARLRREDSWALDVLLALAFFALATVDVATVDEREGPVAVHLVVFAAAAVAFAWRRRAPLASVAGVYAAAVLLSAVLTPIDVFVVSLLILIVPPYSVAAWADQRRAITGLVVALAGAAAVNAIAGHGVSDYAFTSLLISLSWFAGRAIRGRRLLAAALTERARRLEAEREDRARLAVADERTRIARELHAVVANSVSAMVVQAEGARHLLDDPDRAEPVIATIEQTGREALTEMRRVLGVLRREGEAAKLAPQPGIAQLGDLVEQGRAAGVEIELQVEGEPWPLAPGMDLTGYRILQGALGNVLEHAPHGRAGVIVRYHENDVELELFDDGPSEGRGVDQLGPVVRERVEIYGGELNWGPRPGGGYEVRARLPRSYDEVPA